MKWNFPIRKKITCSKCHKEFEMVLTSRSSERHPCPYCGTVHRFDFAAAEKKVLAAAKDEIKKAFRK
jgi:DNA-directed RNA polymerase subunit RPC12/RpoP